MAYSLRTAPWLAPCLALVALAAPARAADLAQPAHYQPVTMQKDGSVDPASLERTVETLARKLGSRPSEVVLLVHGYNTTEKWGRFQYDAIAGRLREQWKSAGVPVEVVGVHWASYPGNGWEWIPKVVGYRFVAELGFRNALRNPYWEKVQLARKTGRNGLRTLAFRIQDRLPNARLHAWAHSMGGEVVLRALAPEVPRGETSAAQPDRELHLGVVALAGADLDEDVFSSRKDPTARLALDRADLWWVTVPNKDVADAVLELRRGAGRRDAIGNLGPVLYRPDLERLLSRRGLVIDDQEVPIAHAIESYYETARVEAILAAMSYLRDPQQPEARRSIPAALASSATATGAGAPPALASLRVYARWREDPKARSFGAVRVAAGKVAAETP